MPLKVKDLLKQNQIALAEIITDGMRGQYLCHIQNFPMGISHAFSDLVFSDEDIQRFCLLNV